MGHPSITLVSWLVFPKFWTICPQTEVLQVLKYEYVLEKYEYVVRVDRQNSLGGAGDNRGSH